MTPELTSRFIFVDGATLLLLARLLLIQFQAPGALVLVLLNQQQPRSNAHTAAAGGAARGPIAPLRNRTHWIGNLDVGGRALGLHTFLLLNCNGR